MHPFFECHVCDAAEYRFDGFLSVLPDIAQEKLNWLLVNAVLVHRHCGRVADRPEDAQYKWAYVTLPVRYL
jgi:hypothetical protein